MYKCCCTLGSKSRKGKETPRKQHAYIGKKGKTYGRGESKEGGLTVNDKNRNEELNTHETD